MSDTVALRSAVAGRERWRIDALRSRPRYAAAVERSLSRHAAVRLAWANPLTGRLLLQYDPGVQRGEIRDRLYASLDAEPASAGELEGWRATWPRGFNRSPEETAVEQARLRLILSAGLFTGVLAKRALTGAGMFAGSPFFVHASAAMTIVTGYTALRRGFDAIAGMGGLSSRTILTTATLALLVAAESLDGLGAHVVAHAGELYERVLIRDSHAAIRSYGYEVSPSAGELKERFEAVSTAAVLAALGMLAATGEPQRSIAMLVGAVPTASTESRITAESLALGHALRRGILFRNPQVLASHSMPAFAVIGESSAEEIESAEVLLIDGDPERIEYAKALLARTSRIVAQDHWMSRAVGVAGFTAAALGKLPTASAAQLHNYTRFAMELNSLRLVRAS